MQILVGICEWMPVFKEYGFVYCAKSKEIDVRKKEHLMQQRLTGILFCSESGNNRTLGCSLCWKSFQWQHMVSVVKGILSLMVTEVHGGGGEDIYKEWFRWKVQMSLVKAEKKMSNHFKSIGIQCVSGEHHFCKWVTGWYLKNQLQLLPVMFLLLLMVVTYCKWCQLFITVSFSSTKPSVIGNAKYVTLFFKCDWHKKENVEYLIYEFTCKKKVSLRISSR